MFIRIKKLLWIALFLSCFSTFAKEISIINSTSTPISEIYLFESGKKETFITVNIPVKSIMDQIPFRSKEAIEKTNRRVSFNLSLKPDTEYDIVLRGEDGRYFAREHVDTKDISTSLIEFKDANRVSRKILDAKREVIHKASEEQKFLLPYIFVSVIFILLILTFAGIFVYDWVKGNPGKFLSDLRLNIPVAELSGLVVMIIPLVLSLMPYQMDAEKTYLWFFKHTINKEVHIDATMITMLAACGIYGAFIIRYDYFKRQNFTQVVFSTIQAIVNCWVMASLCSMFVGNQVWHVPFINITPQSLLMAVIVLSWVGAKSISGFIWLILLVCCISHLEDVNNAMGIFGAFYMVTLFAGACLQFAHLSSRKDLKQDFFEIADKSRVHISGDVEAAIEVSEKAGKVAVKAVEAAAMTGL